MTQPNTRGGLPLGAPFGGWPQRVGPPGPPGPMGPPGPPGPMGPPAVTDVYAVELPYEGDVLLRPSLVQVLALAIPAGRALVYGTVGLVNNSPNVHDVDVWLNAVPPPASVLGPRAAHVTLAPLAVASVALGPALAVIGDGGTSALVVAQRDDRQPSDEVWAVEGTTLLRRAGATGLVALMS